MGWYILAHDTVKFSAPLTLKKASGSIKDAELLGRSEQP